MINKNDILIHELLKLCSNEAFNVKWQKLSIADFSMVQSTVNGRECPFCGSHQILSKGNYRNRKRYKCKACTKSFNDLTKTPFNGIHDLEKVKKYLNCMIEGKSIRKTARIIGISVPTSFNWRHKLLNGMKKLPSPKMNNVREISEIVLPFSAKGQKSNIVDSLNSKTMSAIFVCDRTGKIDSDAILSSHKSNNPLFKRLLLNSTEHTDLICSPNFINNYNSLKLHLHSSQSPYSSTNTISSIISCWIVWMKRFHGVASKYLNNYLHWFDYLDNILFNSNKLPTLVQLLLLK